MATANELFLVRLNIWLVRGGMITLRAWGKSFPRIHGLIMFSGIVEEMGALKTVEKSLGGARISILASTVLQELQIGESVSVSGTCLTVTDIDNHEFSVDVSSETLNRTTLGLATVGDPVNLERAMKLNERIGGHLVTGHIDGIGIVRERSQDGNSFHLAIEAPEGILRYCVQKGSITVDGI